MHRTRWSVSLPHRYFGDGEQNRINTHTWSDWSAGTKSLRVFQEQYAARWTGKHRWPSAQALAIRASFDARDNSRPSKLVIFIQSGYGYAAKRHNHSWTGLNVASRQQVAHPLISTLLVIPAWVPIES